MTIAGLDLSLAATGVCTEFGTTVITSRKRGIERLVELRDVIVGYVQNDTVFVEGYSMGAQRGSQGVAQMLGELGGVVRVAFFEAGIRWMDVPPATLKKFATGKGNAGKPDMLAAAIRCGYEGSNDNNCVDAWWLRQFGLYMLDGDTVPATAYRDEAVAKLAVAS